MDFRRATDIVVHADLTDQANDLPAALTVLVTHLRTHTLSSSQSDIICISLIERVAAHLSTSALGATPSVVRTFHTIFLRLPPALAFSHLLSALSPSSVATDLLAETLIHFTTHPPAAPRLTRLISTADETIPSALAHLPSRLANVQGTPHQDTPVLDESAYFKALSSALVAVSKADTALSRTYRKIVSSLATTGHAQSLLHAHLGVDDSTRLTALFCQASPAAQAILLREALSLHVTHSQTITLATALRHGIATDAGLRSLCVSRVPFARPLLRRPRVSLLRLVKAVADNTDGLDAAIATWADEEFARGADVPFQRQVTRVLLYYLRRTPREHGLGLLDVARGIQLRLGESDIRLRRYAMVVGEAASRRDGTGETLAFDRVGVRQERELEERAAGRDGGSDDGDSDFSELAACVNDPFSDVESNELDGIEGGSNVEPLETNESASINGGKMDEKRKADAQHANGTALGSISATQVDERPLSDWEVVGDDWSSAASYEQTSSDSDNEQDLYRDEAAVREQLPSAHSVPRLLALLRQVNASTDGAPALDAATAASALRVARARAATASETIRAAAPELCLEATRVDVERYPDVHISELSTVRDEAALAFLAIDLGGCAVLLVQRIVCGPSADLAARERALALLGTAVRAAEEREKEAGGVDASTSERESEKQLIQPVGTVVRRLRAAPRHVRGRAVHGEPFARLFRVLVDGLLSGGGADFVDVDGRDVRLWAHALVVAATAARAAGAGACGRALRAETLELGVRHVARLNGDPVARRAVALAVGAVVDGMTDGEVEEAAGLSAPAARRTGIIVLPKDDGIDDEDGRGEVTRECFDWLTTAAEGDADVGVRRFAAISMRKWAVRLESINNNDD